MNIDHYMREYNIGVKPEQADDHTTLYFMHYGNRRRELAHVTYDILAAKIMEATTLEDSVQQEFPNFKQRIYKPVISLLRANQGQYDKPNFQPIEQATYDIQRDFQKRKFKVVK